MCKLLYVFWTCSHSLPLFSNSQSSIRWRWCAVSATWTSTICTWAGTSPPTMAPSSAEPCWTLSSATSMPLRSLLCSSTVSPLRQTGVLHHTSNPKSPFKKWGVGHLYFTWVKKKKNFFVWGTLYVARATLLRPANIIIINFIFIAPFIQNNAAQSAIWRVVAHHFLFAANMKTWK